MGAFAKEIIGAAVLIVGPVLAKILALFGLSFITYTGLDYGVEMLIDSFTDELSGLPLDTLRLLNISGGLTAMSMIFSALTVRVTIDLVGGVFKLKPS